MTEKVLSEGEMDALMDGVASGKVEVQTGAGATQAEVRVFEIDPRSYVRSGTLPGLQKLNDSLAEHLQRFFRNQLLWPVNCDLKSQAKISLSDLNEKYSGLQLASVFLMPPLQGPALLLLDSSMLDALVEKFFGSPSVVVRKSVAESFSPGELRIAQRFADEVLLGMKNVWESRIVIEPEFVQTEQSLDRINLGAEKDQAVLSTFQVDADEFNGELSLVIPLSTLGDLLAVLEGVDKPGSAEQNARWSQILQQHISRTDIPLDACTDSVRVNLGSVVELKPGDVLPISAPNEIRVSSGAIPLMSGEFGTHLNKCCVRTVAWAIDHGKPATRSFENV